jgi:hypothetical protein
VRFHSLSGSSSVALPAARSARACRALYRLRRRGPAPRSTRTRLALLARPPAVLARESGLMFQVVRDVRDDDALAEQERALDEEGGLVVEQVLPEARGDELRRDDRGAASGCPTCPSGPRDAGSDRGMRMPFENASRSPRLPS